MASVNHQTGSTTLLAIAYNLQVTNRTLEQNVRQIPSAHFTEHSGLRPIKFGSIEAVKSLDSREENQPIGKTRAL